MCVQITTDDWRPAIGCITWIFETAKQDIHSFLLPPSGNRKRYSIERACHEMEVYVLNIDGLQGGHSGVDIHKKLGIAIKVTARVLEGIRKQADIQLVALEGGSRINVIPRQTQAIIAFEPGQRDRIQGVFDDLRQEIGREFERETNLTIVFSPLPFRDKSRAGFSAADTGRIIALLLNLPNGVAAMDPRYPGSVETSNNLATVKSDFEGIHLMSFQRSSDPAALDERSTKIRTIAWKAGGEGNDVSRLAAWQPDFKSNLVARSQDVFQKLYGHPPALSVVHGGLECGVIALKYPGLDVMSIGPSIQGAHSPAEKLFLPSVAKVREFLSALLASFNNLQ